MDDPQSVAGVQVDALADAAKRAVDFQIALLIAIALKR